MIIFIVTIIFLRTSMIETQNLSHELRVNSVLIEMVKSMNFVSINALQNNGIQQEKINQKMTRNRGYSFISMKRRQKLVILVESEGWSISKAGRRLGIKCSTAKVIYRRYRETGKFFMKKKENNCVDIESKMYGSKEVTRSQEINYWSNQQYQQCYNNICYSNTVFGQYQFLYFVPSFL